MGVKKRTENNFYLINIDNLIGGGEGLNDKIDQHSYKKEVRMKKI